MFEVKNRLYSVKDVQLIKVDEVSHVAEAFRETDHLAENKFKFEKLETKIGYKRTIDIDHLEMKRQFVSVYLACKAKIPVGKEMKSSGKGEVEILVHEMWELVLKNRVNQANWKQFIAMFVTDRERKRAGRNGKGAKRKEGFVKQVYC